MSDIERQLLDAAAELNARVESVHERVACPRCGMAVGTRCVRVGRGPNYPPLKHPHDARIRADGISLR